VPVFAVAVIAGRTAGATIPDRAGARVTLAAAAPTAAAGLLILALAPTSAVAVAGAVAAGAGQALAVPALGLLALARTEPAQHGAAAGLFFAWFDAGVGLGGPMAGLLATANGPSGALLGAAVAVACAVPVALVTATRGVSHPLVN
jgi:predicted MFS family arabinose efflux permease